jgi:hypothetical protein
MCTDFLRYSVTNWPFLHCEDTGITKDIKTFCASSEHIIFNFFLFCCVAQNLTIIKTFLPVYCDKEYITRRHNLFFLTVQHVT